MGLVIVITPLQIGIGLLLNLLSQYKNLNAVTSIIQPIENAIAELLKAHGSEITEGQLETLRVEVPWDKSQSNG